MRTLLVCISLLYLAVQAQDGGQCRRDSECGNKDPCCSRYGFCGEDEGYCYPIDGCLLRGIEIQGGDLPRAEGGDGVTVDRGDLDGCAFICEENSRCKWYTYDKQSNLCYLKYARGYLVNATDSSRVISGSTETGGCVMEGGCQEPYRRAGSRCIHYCQDYPQWGVDWSNNRRGFSQASKLCEQYGGSLPYSFQGSEPSQDIGSDWHWLNYPPVGDTCLAIRPAQYQDGAAYFPCQYKFNMACEQDMTIPLPIPSYPRIVRLTNSSQYNYNYQPCPKTVTNCRGRWMGGNLPLYNGINYSSRCISGCPDNDYNKVTVDVLGTRSRPIIIVNNNLGRQKSVRDILALAAARNPFLRYALGSVKKR